MYFGNSRVGQQLVFVPQRDTCQLGVAAGTSGFLQTRRRKGWLFRDIRNCPLLQGVRQESRRRRGAIKRKCDGSGRNTGLFPGAVREGGDYSDLVRL